jgi:hypothetical protein
MHMPLFQLTPDKLSALPKTTFAELGIKERSDLQRLLRANLSAIAPDCLILAEEFSEWEDSKKRIDLLALDRDANLVVIELKRDEDGGHMDLQALRYAAMVSTMTFQDAVESRLRFLAKHDATQDARASILNFLDWSSPEENAFAEDVRIVLASADFSRELTTSVLWLNQRDIDVRCVRIRPYRLADEVVLDIQQIIPLPEAQEFQVQLRQKVREERSRTDSYRDFTRYDLRVGSNTYTRLAKREFVFRVVQHAMLHEGATPEDIASTIHQNHDRIWREAPGTLNSGQFVEYVGTQSTLAGRAFNPRRFFCASEELFHLNGKTYAFSNQWGGQGVVDSVDALLTKYGNGKISYEPAVTSVV